MAHTHYWYVGKEIDRDRFNQIRDDVRLVLERMAPYRLVRDHDGGKYPFCSHEEIRFNGRRDFEESGETFVFPRRYEPTADQRRSVSYYARHKDRYPRLQGKFPHSCNTDRHYYDLAVTAVLIIAKHRLHDDILVLSAGARHEWGAAMVFCQDTLGYGLDFVLDVKNGGGS